MAIVNTPTIGAFVNIAEQIASGASTSVPITATVAIGSASTNLSTTGGSGTSCTVVLDGQVAAAGNTSVDLSSFSSRSATKTLAKVHGVLIYNASTSGVTAISKGAVNGFVGGAIATTTAWSVDPGATYFQTIPTTAGATVDGTHKTVQIDNTAGNGICYFCFFGE